MDVDEIEDKKEEDKTQEVEPGVENEELQDNQYQSLYVKEPYEIDNMTRVLPAQMKYVTFSRNSRFTPLKKFRSICGIVILKDNEPTKPFDKIKTLREKT